jgi:hypothetical protein
VEEEDFLKGIEVSGLERQCVMYMMHYLRCCVGLTWTSCFGLTVL